MMAIMPFVFGIMFIFFASGLVLYWLVNNILSIIQQYVVNKQIEADRIKRSLTNKKSVHLSESDPKFFVLFFVFIFFANKPKAGSAKPKR